MGRFREWLGWELGREIELTAGLRLIVLDRFAKAAVLVVGGVALLVLGRTDEMSELLQRISFEYNLAPGTGLWHRLTHLVLGAILRLPGSRITDLAVAGLAYGVLETFEGTGLLLRRRWAEYLVLLATLAFLPVEIDELHRRLTFFRFAALAINVAIVGYLVWRKRLFVARRPA